MDSVACVRIAGVAATPYEATVSARHDDPHSGRWRPRLPFGWLPIVAAALVFGGLWATGALALLPALGGFVLLAAAFVITPGNGREEAQTTATAGEPRGPGIVTLIEGVLAGLPDPVVAINRRDEVVGLNAAARALAPYIPWSSVASRRTRLRAASSTPTRR